MRAMTARYGKTLSSGPIMTNGGRSRCETGERWPGKQCGRPAKGHSPPGRNFAGRHRWRNTDYGNRDAERLPTRSEGGQDFATCRPLQEPAEIGWVSLPRHALPDGVLSLEVVKLCNLVEFRTMRPRLGIGNDLPQTGRQCAEIAGANGYEVFVGLFDPRAPPRQDRREKQHLQGSPHPNRSRVHARSPCRYRDRPTPELSPARRNPLRPRRPAAC